MDTIAYSILVAQQGSMTDGVFNAIIWLVAAWAVVSAGHRIARHSTALFMSRRAAIAGLIVCATLGSYLLGGAWATEHFRDCRPSIPEPQDSVTLESVAAGMRLTAACEQANDRIRERYQIALAIVIVVTMTHGFARSGYSQLHRIEDAGAAPDAPRAEAAGRGTAL